MSDSAVIHTDSNAVSAIKGRYVRQDSEGNEVTFAVDHPSELGLRQIRTVMRAGQILSNASDFANADDDELDAAVEAASEIMFLVIDGFTEDDIKGVSEMDRIVFATSFFEALSNTIGSSAAIQYPVG